MIPVLAAIGGALLGLFIVTLVIWAHEREFDRDHPYWKDRR